MTYNKSDKDRRTSQNGYRAGGNDSAGAEYTLDMHMRCVYN